MIKVGLGMAQQFWKPLALISLVALSIWGFGRWCYTAGKRSSDLSWSKQWTERNAADAEAKSIREARERTEEQRRQRAVDEERERTDEELAKVQADADAAEHARNGLQRQIVNLQQQLAGSETGRLSAIAAAGATKAETTRVLAELLGESDKRAGIYAKEADERYAAGSSCERTYDKVTAQ